MRSGSLGLFCSSGIHLNTRTTSISLSLSNSSHLFSPETEISRATSTAYKPDGTREYPSWQHDTTQKMSFPPVDYIAAALLEREMKTWTDSNGQVWQYNSDAVYGMPSRRFMTLVDPGPRKSPEKSVVPLASHVLTLGYHI